MLWDYRHLPYVPGFSKGSGDQTLALTLTGQVLYPLSRLLTPPHLHLLPSLRPLFLVGVCFPVSPFPTPAEPWPGLRLAHLIPCRSPLPTPWSNNESRLTVLAAASSLGPLCVPHSHARMPFAVSEGSPEPPAPKPHRSAACLL